MTRTCCVANCPAPVKARGMCRRHYQTAWRTGSPIVKRPTPHGTSEQRFWRHVDRRDDGACWPWMGRSDKDGYGSIKLTDGKHRTVRAHRFSFLLHGGELTAGQAVLHRCGNPACVNPNHLYAGDHNANMADRKAAGHYLTGADATAALYSTATVKAIYRARGKRKEIAARFGVSPSQVTNIKRRRQRPDAWGGA